MDMMTVKQVSSLTGVSVRTLQFYDEIGLLRPSKTTAAGYRLYDGHALEDLQQILFFKELDFTLKEIKAIMADPRFDRQAAYVKQRELVALKRDRLTALLGLLDKLVKGETSVDVKDFDLRAYFRVLRDFEEEHAEQIAQWYGSMEQFDAFVAGIKTDEARLARTAVNLYGSVENYAKATRNNLTRLLERGPAIAPEDTGELMERTEAITRKLTADPERDPASPEVREVVGELLAFINGCNEGVDMGEHYWSYMAESYRTNPAMIEVNDKKYGPGASNFIGRAIQAYLGGA